MSLALQFAICVLALPFIGGSLYLGLLATIAALPSRGGRRTWPGAQQRFAFVIPARNEASRIAALIDNLHRLDYPPDQVSILVVADNCTDDTAAVARARGADVVERFDEAHVGKGYALAFGLERVAHPYDAVVFVDGDCTVNRSFLCAVSAKIDAGAEVVQALYSMAPDGDARSRAVRALALNLVHFLRPLAKERIGASAGLKGSGMCFSRAAIERLGWTSTGLAEDVEQHVRLLRAGYRVAFAPEAVVTGTAPETLNQSEAQHRRWEAGRAAAARQHGLGMLLEGIRAGSIARVDAGVELLLPPLSVVVAALVALLTIGTVMRWPIVVAGGAISAASIAWYVVTGLMLQRLGRRGTIDALLSMPNYAVWKLRLYAGAVARSPRQWEPTRGSEEKPSR